MNTVYSKLNAARAEFHTLKLKKTGLNKFAGYSYFELSDFLIPALEVFSKHGLCAFISFGETLATMKIVSAESGDVIELTSPMAEANLKGCHPIQNLGAVETYTRRYLWVAALEIVEHDALDSSEPVKTKPVSVAKDTMATMGEEAKAYLSNIANEVNGLLASGDVPAAVARLEADKLDADEKVAIWGLFDSKARAAIKKFQSETAQ